MRLLWGESSCGAGDGTSGSGLLLKGDLLGSLSLSLVTDVIDVIEDG